MAEALPAKAWKRLERVPQYDILTAPRRKAMRHKEQIVIEKEFMNQVLVGEDIAEIDYQPLKCNRKYRLVIVPHRARGLELVKAEFRRFLNAILLIPCQIVRTARRIIYRVLGYNGWLSDFLATWERLRRLVLVA